MEDDSQLLDLTQWDYASTIRHRQPRHDWDPDDTYDESPPTCVHYSIEWKLQLRKGRLSKLINDTEQDLVLAPGAFWDATLEDKVDKLLKQKTPRGKCYVPEETIVVVSVTDRSERDLTKRFDEFNVDWKMAEEQLCKWSHLFRAGKKLRIDISFICKDVYDLMRCNGNLCPGSYCYADEQRKHMGLNTSILT
ncbi:hypothetical protein FOPG_17594 [Fusarium oxysporum f. sp. conglutinans race 2 54008]|uniref:Uncharacterized protein n=1 Tax=Fusarium oxysporum f. sp. conglutinans race 2 54008 TaxID=1089457 RepID=X0GRG4_FUSOX|nr:hypothetical protein FOPG_17594 [Fusarium oxysporum f. sp. conglutinans race 2 54008]